MAEKNQEKQETDQPTSGADAESAPPAKPESGKNESEKTESAKPASSEVTLSAPKPGPAPADAKPATKGKAPARRAPKRASKPKDRFLVVALGASAGGLEAVRELLSKLPANSGMAFILVQHLEPDRKSMLADLLARDTAMQVLQVNEDTPIKPNCVYVIPPRAYMSVQDGMLQLCTLKAHHHVHTPFDLFLNSLAEEYGKRAVCIVLSGTGADGSVGLKAVSEKGGLVIAQDPNEADFDGMPRSAIATGGVNLVLQAGQIPLALIKYAQHPYITSDPEVTPPDERATKALAAIIKLLRTHTTHDFSRYKQTTLYRRIQRRMAATGIKDIDNYVKILRKDHREAELLAKNLLIHVTRFFRDQAAYDALAKTVIPELVRLHSEDQPIRVWVPGCSTGEEAYSLAMLFLEEFAAKKRSPNLQIFASDVNPDAVSYARTGLYPESITADVSPQRLAHFFTREDRGYRIKRDLRELIVFAVQDLLVDPPFMRLDFISCRNLLIYLQPEEQERAVLLFHYALAQGGFLFLGTSETIGKLTDHFEAVPETQRAFRKIGHSLSYKGITVPTTMTSGRLFWPRMARQTESKRPNFGDVVQNLLLEAYAPAAVLVNRKSQALYFFGATDRYLQVAAGEPSGHLPAMLREGLASKVRTAIQQASQKQTIATIGGAQIKRHGTSVSVSISARPVHYEGQELVLVTFTDEPEQKAASVAESPAETSRVAQLEEELETSRKDLENTIRELEASNQELTALNEEAASMNEEFQSTNEELETSREELQSVNEELVRVNNELQESLEKQRATSDDLQNILNSSAIATIFLDKALNIRVFTPAAAPLFNLIATDIGRPLADLAIRFDGIDLLGDVRKVLDAYTPIKRQVTTTSGAWYLCSISPYRTHSNRVEGVIINFADISELKANEQELRAAHAYTEEIINTIHTPLVVVNEDLKVISASQSFYRFFNANVADTLGRLLSKVDTQHLDTPALRALLDRLKGKDEAIESYEMAIDLPSVGKRILAVTAQPIHNGQITGKRTLISFNDITEFKLFAEQLDAAKQAAEQANLAKSRFLAAASHDLRQPLQTLSLLRAAMKQRTKDAEMLTLLSKAERVSETMAGVLAALLDINQLETGAILPTCTDFPLDDLFDALSSEFAEEVKNKGLNWRITRCGLTVRSDRRLLEEIVRNLLSNAIRYTDKGTISLKGERHDNGVRIEVKDTGIGISKDELSQIFDEYHKAADVAKQGGLGLGLAIVQRLGELLAHPIGVRSKIGKGSTFFIGVPLAGQTPLQEEQSQELRQHGKGSCVGTILIIEDEPSVRQSLQAMIRSEGHRVTAVTNGQAALDRISKDGMRPDLVISDYNLPGELNGVQTAAALRRNLKWQVPVIILSGDVRAETLRNIKGSECISLTKPARAVELAQLVQHLLASQPPATAPAMTPPAAEPGNAAAAGTLFVVDDNHDTRDAMRALLTHAGYRVKTFANAKAFLDSYRAGDKGCIITDVRMPGMNGLEMLAHLAAEGSLLPAIVITGQGDIAMAVEAMRAGAADFIEKPVKSEALLISIHRALQQAASPQERSARRAEAAMRIAGLTKREREVMDLVVAGHPNKEIAARLGISQRTVETHRATIMTKMGASSLSDLVRLEIVARGDWPSSFTEQSKPKPR